MQPENLTSKPYRFSDTQQERIYDGLLLVSLGAASFYRDACRIMEADPSFDSATHLVAHLIREIESSVRWALEPYKEHPENHDIVLKYEEAYSVLEKAGIADTDPIAVDWLNFISTLSPGHKNDIRAVLKGLEIPETDDIAVTWLNLAGTFQHLAHRENLAPPRPLDDKFRHLWQQINDILDGVLDKLAARYLKVINFLDYLLDKESPTKADAKRLNLNVPHNPALYQYFFHRLNNPAWLKLLKTEHFFAHPFKTIYEPTDTGYLISSPMWPQSRYLVRMAALPAPDVQQTVLEITLRIETENSTIHMDLVDIAKALPASKASQIAIKEAAWLEKQTQLFNLLPEKVGELISHLAVHGEVDAALDLARSTLAVLPNPRADEDKDSILSFNSDPVSRMPAWDYKQVLRISLSTLVKAGGNRALEMFCNLLETATNYSQRALPEDTDDYSDISRASIEHGDDDDVKDLLITAVRQSSEQLATADPAQVPALVNILESRRWLIFKRMALYLLRFAPSHAENTITEHLLNRENFDKRGLWDEYIKLARDQFNNLAEDNQSKILSWIDEGLSIDFVKQQFERWDEVLLTDEEAEKRIKARKLELLAPLRDVLPEDWRKRYDDWVKDTEEPKSAEYIAQEQFDFANVTSTNVLGSKSIKEIIAFLQEGHLNGSAINYSPESIGIELTSLVASNPEQFARRAGSFKLVNPIYVRSFLSGLLDAAQQPKAFPWRPVITLCRWVVQQSEESSIREGEAEDLNKHWLGTRSVIARLLSTGFQEGATEIPFALRRAAWALLTPFTDDPQPTSEDEERQGGASMNAAAYAMSTVRGAAMHTVMRYAMWVQRHIKKESEGEDRASRGFSVMPEVRKSLEYHLNPKHDPSLAIRAFFGQWLPALTKLDRNWVGLNLTKIFPVDADSRDLLNAAWRTYIRSWIAYTDVFEVLRDEYERAIDRIGEEKDKVDHSYTSDQRLAQHLMRLYSFGKLDLDDPEGLLARFYAKASDDLCGHALWYIGYTLREAKEEVPAVVLERFQALWQKRLHVARSAPDSHTGEMIAFGYLFTSQKFDDVWAITGLKNALELSLRAEVAYLVVQRLAALAGDYPGVAIKCLSFMVKGDKKGWGLNSWGMYMRTIIKAARWSDDEVARQDAVELVHRLAAREHTEFYELR